MSETPDRDDDTVLAGEYALGLLSAEEAAVFEARLGAEPELRALYAAWAEDFAQLAEDIPPETPPAQVKTLIESELFDTPRHSIWSWLGLAAIGGGLAVAALALAVFLGADFLNDGPGAPDYVAEITAEDGSLTIEAAYHAGEARLVLERRAGAARPGRALELWLIDGDAAPASLGVLPDDPHAVLEVAEGHRAAMPNATLAISDEPAGGSPTGLPTGDVLAAGQVSSI